MTEQQALGWRVPVTRLRTHNAIVDRLGLAPGHVLLDLGCGNGFTMATAATRVPGMSLIGLDVDQVALAAAARGWTRSARTTSCSAPTSVPACRFPTSRSPMSCATTCWRTSRTPSASWSRPTGCWLPAASRCGPTWTTTALW